jgi:hypothetical protein
MFKSGWMRLWLVLSVVLLTGVSIASAYYVWGRAACYRFVTVSVADNPQQQDRQLAENVKQETTTKTFCGSFQYSPLLTLEALAQHGVVTQIGLQWLEPSGWSFNDHDTLEVLNKSEIKASEIIGRASAYVHHARLLYVVWFIVAALLMSLASLAVGFGTAWVRRGFEK